MKLGNFIKKIARKPAKPRTKPISSTRHHNTYLDDFYFTANFHVKAEEWGLTEDHAKRVYYEGDPVKGKGKENMKVMTYKGEEIGIYAFHDRDTNKPVVTSIWKRHPHRK